MVLAMAARLRSNFDCDAGVEDEAARAAVRLSASARVLAMTREAEPSLLDSCEGFG